MLCTSLGSICQNELSSNVHVRHPMHVVALSNALAMLQRQQIFHKVHRMAIWRSESALVAAAPDAARTYMFSPRRPSVPVPAALSLVVIDGSDIVCCFTSMQGSMAGGKDFTVAALTRHAKKLQKMVGRSGALQISLQLTDCGHHAKVAHAWLYLACMLWQLCWTTDHAGCVSITQ